jgi:DNA-binding CsgD family transcriptional regulator
MSEWADSYKVADGDMYSPAERAYAMANKSKSAKDIKKAKNATTNFKVRGKGVSGKTTRPMSDDERESILVLKTKGLTNEEIAEKTHRTVQTVTNVLKTAEAKTIDNGLDWRDVMEGKARIAVNAGLDCEDDPYKRGGLGVQTLKGLGTFENEGNVNIAALIGQIPESQKSRYITTGPADPNLITSQPIKEISNDSKE